MIKIFYCNSSDENIPSEISEQRINKILSAKKDRQAQINTARALKVGFASFSVNECDVIYDFGKNGKPFAKNFPDIHFSISHSDNFSIIAFCNKDIGVDCENSTKIISTEILTRYFSSSEYNDFFDVPLRLWLSKEAYVKYTGAGFALGRNKLEIPYFDDELSVNGIWLKRITLENFECIVCTDSADEISVQKII